MAKGRKLKIFSFSLDAESSILDLKRLGMI